MKPPMCIDLPGVFCAPLCFFYISVPYQNLTFEKIITPASVVAAFAFWPSSNPRSRFFTYLRTFGRLHLSDNA